MNPKKRGLGRGLDALFEDKEVFTGEAEVGVSGTPSAGRTILDIDLLHNNPFRPRKYFDEAALEELTTSIKNHGVLQPLLVRESPHNPGQYEIIAGERRWQAAQRAQLHEVSVAIVDLNDAEAFEVALVENLQREDLNPSDEAFGYQRLVDEYGYTQEKLAQILGKSRSHVANMLRLLNLPTMVRAHLDAGDLSIGHARALITADDAEDLAREIISKGLSVRQVEKMMKERSNGGSSKSASNKAPKPGKDVDTLALEKELSDKLGMRISIDHSKGEAGKLSVEYKTLDQLDSVLKLLSA